MRYRPFSADIPENPAVSGGETYWERQARTLSNLYRTMADLKEFRSKTAKFANLGNSVGGRSDVVFLPIPGIYATRRL